MKYIFLLLLLVVCSFSLTAQNNQKHALDSADISRWETAWDGGRLSNDGRYAMINIRNRPIGSKTLVIQETERNGQISIEGVRTYSANFTDKSQQVLYKKDGDDSLHIITLKTWKRTGLVGISSYELFMLKGEEQLILRHKDSPGHLSIRTVGAKSDSYSFRQVVRYWLDEHSQKLYLLQDSSKVSADSSDSHVLSVVSLQTGVQRELWSGTGFQDLVFAKGKGVIAFSSTKDNQQRIWKWQEGMTSAEQVLDDGKLQKNLDTGDRIKMLERLSADGKLLFFYVSPPPVPVVKSLGTGVQVDVWSYLDTRLQNLQAAQPAESLPSSFLVSEDLSTYQVQQLTNINEEAAISINGDWVLATLTIAGGYEDYWLNKAQTIRYKVDVRTGKHTQIKGIRRGYYSSPSGRYGLTKDSSFANCYCYDSQTGLVTDLTGTLPIPQRDDRFDRTFMFMERGLEVVAWLPDETDILFQDRYDLWLISPDGSHAPICVTAGYGRKRQITFRITGAPTGSGVYLKEDEVVLLAFDNVSKEDGFYKVRLSHPGAPQKITMCQCIYDIESFFSRKEPVKARDKVAYLVTRMSTNDAQNYYFTKDFQHFRQLTNVQPQRDVKWEQKRLLTWKTDRGEQLQGILHLPDDFDSTKKYPVIIHYYEGVSDRLYVYPQLRYAGGEIMDIIPWFTGRGYVVFTPDIHYRPGHPGESVLESVESGTDQLVKLPYVDSTRLGIQGHSFGGYETNYIVTHSNRFAAAMSVAGATDLISLQGGIYGAGDPPQAYVEHDQFRMDCILWECPDLYISNSPVFSADKVTTPLLIMHNKDDYNVPFSQSLELYLSLRRLGKRVWLLQYDGEHHGIFKMANIYDYLTRLDQFFAHYLKGAPAPVWMTQGIPFKDKGVRSGLEYDEKINTPGPGLFNWKGVSNRKE